MPIKNNASICGSKLFICRYSIVVLNRLTHTDVQYEQSSIECINLRTLLSLLNNQALKGLKISDLVNKLVIASIRSTVDTINKAKCISFSVLKIARPFDRAFQYIKCYRLLSITPIANIRGSKQANPISSHPKNPAFWTLKRVGSS